MSEDNSVSVVVDLSRQVTELKEQVEDLEFAVTQLTEIVSRVDDNYHNLTDRLVIKTIQKMNQEKGG